MVPNDDTAALVARCAGGDASAWEALVRRYQRLVFAIARRAGLDEHAAADVFQTVFARLVQSLPRLREPQRLQAWIVTTAKRETLLQRSRALRTVSMTTGQEEENDAWEVEDPAPLPGEVLADLQQLDHVRRELDSLDPRCRDLLRLMFSDEGMAYDRIADTLGIAVGSIGPTRARCLDKLRRRLAGAD